MKKAISLLIAFIMVFGVSATAFAQTVTPGIKFNVLVDGEEKSFTNEEAIVVDGLAMLTVDCYVEKFGCPGLTAENIEKAEAFEYGGTSYYGLREVADNCGLNVFWDSATSTALVIDVETYDKITELIEASNANNADVKRAEMDFGGTIGISMAMMGESLSYEFPFSSSIKMDIEAPYMELEFKLESDEMPAEMKMYDNGEALYLNSGGEDEWYQMDSSLADSLDLIDQFQQMSPATNALSEALSIAGLKLTETDDGYVLEGNMYVSETFNGIDMDAIMAEAYAQMGEEAVAFSMDFDWPDTVYVKYTMDKDGNIKDMRMVMGMGMTIGAEGESIDLTVNADINVPKFILDGDFEAAVPQEVIDSATEFAAE